MGTVGRLRRSRECAAERSHEAPGQMGFWFSSGAGIPNEKARAARWRTGREKNEGSWSGNGQRKAAEAEPRRPEETESLGFSL